MLPTVDFSQTGEPSIKLASMTTCIIFSRTVHSIHHVLHKVDTISALRYPDSNLHLEMLPRLLRPSTPLVTAYTYFKGWLSTDR